MKSTPQTQGVVASQIFARVLAMDVQFVVDANWKSRAQSRGRLNRRIRPTAAARSGRFVIVRKMKFSSWNVDNFAPSVFFYLRPRGQRRSREQVRNLQHPCKSSSSLAHLEWLQPKLTKINQKFWLFFWLFFRVVIFGLF